MKRHWAAEFIGLEWAPDRNCWWLVRAVYKLRFGLDLPSLGLDGEDGVSALMAAANAAGIHPASGPAQDGDIILCRDLTGKRHVGTMIELGGAILLLHNDGHMTPQGPIGSVRCQRLAESQLIDIECWRRAS
jgi:hypothetical protein